MPTPEQVNRLVAMQELERRGELPEQFAPLLGELRNRGVVPPVSEGPLAGMGGAQTALAGIGKAGVDIWRGARQRVQEQQQELMPDVALPSLERTQADIVESQALDQPLVESPAGLGGNIAGNVTFGLPAAFIPGAGTYMGAGLIGGGIGAAAPEQDPVSGALGGLFGRAVAGGISRALSPKTPENVRMLADEGVPLTPGQIVGGPGKWVEDKAMSVPILGDMVRMARGRSFEGFNKATLNRVLNPINESTDKIGREGLQDAYTKVGAAYDDATQGLRIDVDQTFLDQIRGLRSLTSKLPPERAKQVESIIQDSMVSKIGSGRLSGDLFKRIDSDLGQFARTYGGSQDADQRLVGRAVRSAQKALRELAARTNPDKAEAIRNADDAYSMLLRAENAGGRVGASEGVFTPAQLLQAARQMDSSLRKRGFSHGEALMQDLAEAGKNVIPSEIPNSGTMDRFLLAGGTALASPETALALGGAGLLYTRPMQALAQGLLMDRPAAARAAGAAVGRALPLSGTLGAGLMSNRRRR